MILRIKDTSVVLRIGMACLAVANISQWFLRRNAHFSPDVIDGVTGLLFGVAIGCLLLAIVHGRRRSAGK